MKKITSAKLAQQVDHWTVAAAKRVIAGERFEDVMQDVARKMSLHDVSSFRSVEQAIKKQIQKLQEGSQPPSGPLNI